MIVYFKCACTSKDKLKVKELRSLGHEVRLTNKSREWKLEARLYNLPLPFKVIDEKLKEGAPLE